MANLEAKRIDLETISNTAHQTFMARADQYRSLLTSESPAIQALKIAQKRYEAGVSSRSYLAT